MARVPYVSKESLPAADRELLREASESNITRALSNSPKVAHLSGTVAKYIRDNRKLDPRLRELALIQVGYAANSPYEYAHHIEIGARFGVTDADVRAVAEETAGKSSSLEPIARAVLRAAREMTAGNAISDATFAELRKELDNEQLVELIFATGNYIGVSLMLKSMQVELEAESQHIMEKFPIART
jgi:alkylhydroperoxidase family enzyme